MVPLSSCTFNVCGSYAHFVFAHFVFPMQTSIEQWIKVYCESQETIFDEKDFSLVENIYQYTVHRIITYIHDSSLWDVG